MYTYIYIYIHTIYIYIYIHIYIVYYIGSMRVGAQGDRTRVLMRGVADNKGASPCRPKPIRVQL